MSIQWGRVLLAAFLMELVLFAIAIPLFLSGAGRVLVYVVPPAALVATFAITVWLGRRINSNFVLHGAHRRCRHTHVRRSHPRETGTLAILGCPRVEGCWRRRWWNGPGAASDCYELATEGR